MLRFYFLLKGRAKQDIQAYKPALLSLSPFYDSLFLFLSPTCGCLLPMHNFLPISVSILCSSCLYLSSSYAPPSNVYFLPILLLPTYVCLPPLLLFLPPSCLPGTPMTYKIIYVATLARRGLVHFINLVTYINPAYL